MMKSERTKIEFDYGNKHYRLMYTANSLKKLERAGVKFNKLEDMIFSAPEQLFRGAFYANHPTEDERTIHEIYMALKRTAENDTPEYDEDGHEIDKLTQALGNMIAEAVEELTGRGEQGNVVWKVT